MPRKGQRLRTRKPARIKPAGPKRLHDDPLARLVLTRYMDAHFEWMLTVGYSADTVRARRVALRRFISWCDERGLQEPKDITKPVIERYQRSLFYYRKPDGAPLTLGTQLQCLAPLKTFFKWLARENFLLFNPASELQLPKQPKRLPRALLSVPEVEAILAEAIPDNAQGLRDRALLELLYSTGLRRMELPGVKLYDVDLCRQLLSVREGKGGRERIVPIGARACAWLDRYLIEARPQLIAVASEVLFVTDYGEPVSPAFVAAHVKKYMQIAGIDKIGATHLLRHACATHMLEGGADIRFIQAMLGHANLQTTEIYTHVSIDKLQAVHAATHPARLERSPDAIDRGMTEDTSDARDALLDAIEAEDEGERDDGVDGHHGLDALR